MPFGIVKVTDSEGLARETGHAAPEGTPRQGEERDRPPHRGQRRARRMEEREVGATLRRGAPRSPRGGGLSFWTARAAQACHSSRSLRRAAATPPLGL